MPADKLNQFRLLNRFNLRNLLRLDRRRPLQVHRLIRRMRRNPHAPRPRPEALHRARCQPMSITPAMS